MNEANDWDIPDTPTPELREAPPEMRPKDDETPGPVNRNPIANAMADAQGVEVGSWAWQQAGIAGWSGQAGSHSSYGWRHDHKLRPDYIRAVLANYGHRRSYYENAPHRQWGYAPGGRPHGWEPESPGDQPNGSVIYMTSTGPFTVSGPDAEHLWLTPLFAVANDSSPILVDTGQGNKLPSNVVAAWMSRMLVSAAVGMIRDKTSPVAPYPWAYGDRATSRLLHTFVEAARLGLLPKHDMPTVALFIRDVVLPFYERSPGIHSFGEWPPGRFPIGLFNGLHWIVPAIADAARLLGTIPAFGDWARRCGALLDRWAVWSEDMHKANVDAYGADVVHVNSKKFFATDTPVVSLDGMIEEFVWSFPGAYRAWSFRAADILSKWLGGPLLKEARDRILKEHKDNDDVRGWLVDADGEYVEKA